MPGDPLPAQALGACVSFTLFPGAQDWGGRGHPNLSAAGDEPGVPLLPLWGLGGRAASPLQREVRKPPAGTFQENTLGQPLLDSCARRPSVHPASGAASPATSGAPVHGTCTRGDVLRASSTYLCGSLPPLVCTILVTFNRRSQGFCW
uniref:Uncharacterized protein n=2 Tax=Rangifer tarandus platyrhynchus TaxID=3082113 RepID=A0ACB0E1W0_RANTA|nr:unnamed protein product [Rangifer tarandus platyrhynchus]CAI9694656.1 unnamed protein product [Rangifer tarandus platyrhynchus]